MSTNNSDTQALFARRIERAGDHQRMVSARRQVVARARARILPVIESANDAEQPEQDT